MSPPRHELADQHVDYAAIGSENGKLLNESRDYSDLDETRLAGADEAEPDQHLHGKFFRFVRNALRCSLPAFLDAFAPALLPSMLLAKDRTAFQALRGFDAATLRCCRDLSLTSLTDSPHAVYRMLISPLLLRYSARELLGGELKKVCVCVFVCVSICLFDFFYPCREICGRARRREALPPLLSHSC